LLCLKSYFKWFFLSKDKYAYYQRYQFSKYVYSQLFKRA
jgi:hypothetical protein